MAAAAAASENYIPPWRVRRSDSNWCTSRADAEWSMRGDERLVDPEAILAQVEERPEGRPPAEWLLAQELERLLPRELGSLLPRVKPKDLAVPSLKVKDLGEALKHAPPAMKIQSMRFFNIALIEIPNKLDFNLDLARAKVLAHVRTFAANPNPRLLHGAVSLLASVFRLLRHLHLYNHIVRSHFPIFVKEISFFQHVFPCWDPALLYDSISLLYKVACKLDTSLSIVSRLAFPS